MKKPIPSSDLDHVLTFGREAFERLRGSRVFITGGTGFFGATLLESLLHANRELDLKLHATVLTRSAQAFSAKSPDVADNPVVVLLEGDVANFAFPSEPHTHVLHAATDSTGAQSSQTAYQLASSIVDGTRHVIEFARHTGAQRLLYVSSGAVYGRSTTLPQTPESYCRAPDPVNPASAYDEAKRMSETLCCAAASDGAFETVIARCFAFVGPHLPLDRHFAIGNFLGSALRGEPIHIRGDGTARRSWMHTADLAVWLWTMLAAGQSGRAYNVGSDEGYTIRDAAGLVAQTLAPGLPIRVDSVADPSAPLNSYVPAINRARQELGLRLHISLTDALERTAAWHRDR